jgi:predicted flap endonuclease-1-like 5' DNA nuclease
MPASSPGEPWSGEIKGRAATRFVTETPLVPTTHSTPAAALPETSEPALAVEPQPSAPAPVEPSVDPIPVADLGEDAAMRAIEGGWSRVRARAMADTPELVDVSSAVAAAQSAVEQVLARSGIDPASGDDGKPIGLTRPRPRGKDNLRRIEGLSPLDESTLNNLGIYHFDQIAGWDAAAVSWMENHVFARGRIGREAWQEQARLLSKLVAG